MRRAVARISAAFVLVFVFSICSKTQSEKPQSERVWFAVEERPRGRLRIEAIATVHDGNLVRFASPCTGETFENLAKIAPASNHLAPGQTYTILFGGTEAGQVRLAERLPGLAAAQASYEGDLKIRGQVRALATDESPAGFRVQSRQAPTQEDKTEALKLAALSQLSTSEPVKCFGINRG
jgi:hypothetical protein